MGKYYIIYTTVVVDVASCIEIIDSLHLFQFNLRTLQSIMANHKADSIPHCLEQTYSWFAGFSTLNGFVQFQASTNSFSKLFWGLLLLLGLGMTAFSVSQCINEYYQFHTLTSLRIVSHRTRDFPAVSICNANRIQCQNLYDLIKSCQVVRKL